MASAIRDSRSAGTLDGGAGSETEVWESPPRAPAEAPTAGEDKEGRHPSGLISN